MAGAQLLSGGGSALVHAGDRLRDDDARVGRAGGAIVDQKYGTKCLMDTKESQAGFQWMYDRIWKDNTFAQPGEIEKKWGDDCLLYTSRCV